MASSTSHVISPEALIRLRYYHVVTTFGKEVVFRIFNWCFLHGTTKSVLDILRDNSIPLGKKSNFTKDEIRRLTKNPPETLDISAVYKICEALWEKNVNDPGENLRKLLKKLKDERNNLSHNELRISESQLKTKLSEVNQILQDALDEAKSLYLVHKASIDSLKIRIQEDISKITEKIREKYDALDHDDMKKLQQEIEEFGDSLHDYIQEKTQKELSAIYEILCRILPFEWLAQYSSTFPCSFSVSMKMNTDIDFHSGFFTNTAVTLNQNDLLQAKDPGGNDPKVIIISGDAGSGKSTLLSSIMENWYKGTHNMPCLSSFQILLNMQFRKHDQDNFNDYLRDLLQQTVLDFPFDLVKSFIFKSRCLILCDGYDEANVNSMKLFQEIIELKIANLKIIVTTRPMNTKELTMKTNRSKHHRLNVTLLGLRKEDMESHIKTLTGYLKRDVKERDRLKKKLSEVFKTLSPEMRQILRVPLWFNVFILLQIECPDEVGDINSVTALYLQMNKHNKERLIGKLGITDDKIALIDKVYRECSFRYFIQNKYELSQNDADVLQAKCKELGLDFELIMSSYFSMKHTCKSLDIVKIYCYRHRSEQEFNAASIICDEIVDLYVNKTDQFDKMRENDRHILLNILWEIVNKMRINISRESRGLLPCKLSEVLPFISGILYDKQRSLFYSLFDRIVPVDCESIDPLIKHLNETKNDDHVRHKIMERLKRLSNEVGFYFDVKNTLTLLYLPSVLAEIKPSEVYIYLSSDFDEPGILISALETTTKLNIRTKINSSNNETVPVENYLDKFKSCATFYGRLTVNGIHALPLCLEELIATIDIENLEELSNWLKDRENLVSLVVRLVDDGSADPRSIVPLQFTGRKFSVFLEHDLDVNDSSCLERMADIINAAWPIDREGGLDRNLTICPWKSKFSGDAVQHLLERLSIRPIRVIQLYVGPDAYERVKELKEMCEAKKLGVLLLMPI